MTEYTFQPIGNWYVVAALALVLVAPLLVRPAFGNITLAQRLILICVRVGLILLLLLAILRPTIIHTDKAPQPAALVVMFDQSKSQLLQDLPDSKTRWQGQTELLRSLEGPFRDLGPGLSVRFYGFDAVARPVAFDEGRLALPAQPSGTQTDHGAALDDVRRRETGQRLAGILLVGDGAQAAYSPRIPAQQVAAQLGESGCPIFTVAFGQVRSDRDVAVESLLDQYTVFTKNQLPIQAQVRIQGYTGKDIPVRLKIEDDQGQTVFSDQRTVRSAPDAEGQPLPIEFTYTPDKAGQYKLTLAADPQPEELVAKNNSLTSFVTVLDGGLKILYLESSLEWWEPKFLRRALLAAPDVRLDFVWIDRRQGAAAQANLRELLGKIDYDVYILGDVHSSLLGADLLAKIAAAVDRGKGLLMLGGYYTYDLGGYDAENSPLAGVLPVSMDRNRKQGLDEPIIRRFHYEPAAGFAVRPVATGPAGPARFTSEPTFVTSLAAGEANLALWKKLPRLDRANRWVGVPLGTQVVLETDEPEPLPILVAGVHGEGRTMAAAVNGTWRWQMAGFEAEHRRFWRRMMLWLASKDKLREDVWIDLAQRRFNPGAKVTFRTGAKNSEGEVVADVTLAATVLRPDGRRESITPVRQGDHAEGTITKTTLPGDYVLQITATRGGQPIGTATARFNVFEQDLELSNPSANPAFLEQLAQLTSPVGGRAVAPEDVLGLIEELKRAPPKAEVEIKNKWQLADTALDAWLFFLLAVALLGVEWYLRKRWSMV